MRPSGRIFKGQDMTKVKVLKPFKMNKVGKVVEIDDRMANLMILIGKAELYVEPVKPTRRVTKKKVTAKKDSDVSANTYQTKVMTAEE